ncbi:hypothetical protein TYRP_023089 [Tyrophagus putrescentiae]|nr:hypothetical protein TYRP_023089 [Tyrophagus putrescentiae]
MLIFRIKIIFFNTTIVCKFKWTDLRINLSVWLAVISGKIIGDVNINLRVVYLFRDLYLDRDLDLDRDLYLDLVQGYFALVELHKLKNC